MRIVTGKWCMPHLTKGLFGITKMPMQAQSKSSHVNVEKQLNILNDTLFNIFSNFVRSKVVTVDERDPPWINEEIKCKIKSKNKTFQQYLKNGRKITDFETVDKEAKELSEMIQNRKKSIFMTDH